MAIKLRSVCVCCVLILCVLVNIKAMVFFRLAHIEVKVTK